MKFSGPELAWMFSIVFGGMLALSAAWLDMRRVAWSEQPPFARRFHVASSVSVLIVWTAFVSILIGSLVTKGV